MKKTSVYLSEADIARLDRIARRERRSQAEIIRRAISAYEANHLSNRDFVGARSGEGPGTSVAELPEEELLKGFGS